MNRLLEVGSQWAPGEEMRIDHRQEITQDFLDSLTDARIDSVKRACGEMERVASVPTGVIEVWMREGRDVWNASPSQIVNWLRADDLHAFITTDKNV